MIPEPPPSLESSWIDVTRPLRSEMPGWPGDPPLEVKKICDMAQGGTCNVSEISMCVHTGTHMDAPCHYIPGAPGIEAVPLSVLIGTARVLQCDDPIAVRRAWLLDQDIKPGERLLFKTSSAPPPDKFREDFIYIARDAAELLAQRQVQLVGIDTMSVGGYYDSMVETHTILLGAGIWLVENLDLSNVQPGPCEIICLPLVIPDSDGAPARVLVRSL